jgi:hypothetical protein
MEQQLLRSQGIAGSMGAERIGRDVRVQEHRLSVPDRGASVLEVGPSGLLRTIPASMVLSMW